jgi:uncharacterized Zn finger protein
MEFAECLKNISWDELESTVGPKVFQRGEGYFKSGRVKNLAVTPLGLIADVEGGDSYISLVSFGKTPEDPELSLRCTCPYGSGCKHAVAVILAYVDSIKKNKRVPEVTSSDVRIKRLTEGPRRDDLEEERKLSEKTSKSNPSQDIAEFLSKLSKEALIEMVLQLSSSYPEFRQDLLDRSRLSSGRIMEIASSIRKELKSVMSEPAWHSHWSDEGQLADFSRIEKNLFSIFETEAQITGSWERLVRFLVENKQYEKARAAAEEGIWAIGDKWPGITHSLRKES